MPNLITFIDDEQFFATPYVSELEKCFSVLTCETAEQGLNVIRQQGTLKAIVLDIMMPAPSEAIEGITRDGLDTGLWLLGEIKTCVLERAIAVMVLTNRNANYVRESIEALGYPSRAYEVRAKIETPKFVLPGLLRRLIAEMQETVQVVR